MQYEKKVKRRRASISQAAGAAIGLLALGLVAGVVACWVRVAHGPTVWSVIGFVGAATALALGGLSLIAHYMDVPRSST